MVVDGRKRESKESRLQRSLGIYIYITSGRFVNRCLIFHFQVSTNHRPEIQRVIVLQCIADITAITSHVGRRYHHPSIDRPGSGSGVVRS